MTLAITPRPTAGSPLSGYRRARRRNPRSSHGGHRGVEPRDAVAMWRPHRRRLGDVL